MSLHPGIKKLVEMVDRFHYNQVQEAAGAKWTALKGDNNFEGGICPSYSCGYCAATRHAPPPTSFRTSSRVAGRHGLSHS